MFWVEKIYIKSKPAKLMEKAVVVAKVGGAALISPYIKGLYDYTIDSVFSIFSSDEQDIMDWKNQTIKIIVLFPKRCKNEI